MAKRGRGSLLPEDAIGTATAAWIAGMNLRSLQRWIERGVITPTPLGDTGKGWIAYDWGLSELTTACAIGELRRRGVSAQRVQKAAEAVKRHGEDLGSAWLVVVEGDVCRVGAAGDLEKLTGNAGEAKVYPLGRWYHEVVQRAEKRGFDLLARKRRRPKRAKART